MLKPYNTFTTFSLVHAVKLMNSNIVFVLRLKDMLQELEDLSNALDKISEDEAKSLITHVNTRLRGVLNAEIIDVLFKEEAKGGGVILRPLSSVVTTGGRDEAAPWPVNANSLGVWPRVFFDNKAVWLENIKQKRNNKEGIWNELFPNKSEAELVSGKDVKKIYFNTDSMLCMPLSIEHNMVGLFCIELPESGIINDKIYSFLKRLARCYACLAWQVSSFKLSKKLTIKAIEHFKTSVTGVRISEYVSYSERGVFLRPFGKQFNLIDRALCEAFDANNIELKNFVASPSAGIMNELKTVLKLSPFGVVDISGLNPNVLIEYGMMKVLEKNIMLLRNVEDKGVLPFDINADQVDHYELRGNEAHIIDPSNGNLVPLKERVFGFIQYLRNEGLLQKN